MDNSTKKKAAASAVAAVTAASVLVGGAFSSPADIMDDGPDAHVVTLDMDMDGQIDTGDNGTDDGEEDEGRNRFSASVRRLVRQTPVPLRAFVALPLWLLGTGLIELAAGLWGAVLSPVADTVLNWLAVALVALAVFTLAAKTIAPDMPIKKILNKRSISGVFILCAAFGIADAVLPLFWEGYEGFEKWMRAIGSCLCTAVPIGFFLRWNSRRLKKKAEAEQEAEPSLEERERAARLLIEELADSVCRPR